MPCFSACEYFGVNRKYKGCTYDFLQCPESKIERSYKKHRAMVVRTTDNNSLPPPYNTEFYMINLDPDKKFPKESQTMYVIPCGDLPEELRKDSLMVTLSGHQLSCRSVTKTYPNFRVAGNAIFQVTAIK